MVDESVHGSFERGLQEQIGFGQRRLGARQKRRPVFERPVEAQRHAAEDEPQQQQTQKVIAQKRQIRRFCKKKKKIKMKLIQMNEIK